MIFLCSNINHLSLSAADRLFTYCRPQLMRHGNISAARSCNAAETVIVAGPGAMTNGADCGDDQRCYSRTADGWDSRLQFTGSPIRGTQTQKPHEH
jgi:hypothetical protein